VTCKECAFWAPSNESRCPPTFGWCGSQHVKPGYFSYTSKHFSDTHNLTASDIAVEDDEGWSLFTGPDFGCIHWKAIP
jgi:hypothetical protein